MGINQHVLHFPEIKEIMVNDSCPTIGSQIGQGIASITYFGNERWL
jgi:hypothetical protein